VIAVNAGKRVSHTQRCHPFSLLTGNFRPGKPVMLLPLCIVLQAHAAQELSYSDDGLDWGGTCMTSQRQSPINLVSANVVPVSPAIESGFMFGTGKNVTVGA